MGGGGEGGEIGREKERVCMRERKKGACVCEREKECEREREKE